LTRAGAKHVVEGAGSSIVRVSHKARRVIGRRAPEAEDSARRHSQDPFQRLELGQAPSAARAGGAKLAGIRAPNRANGSGTKKTFLDWSAYDTDGIGGAYSGIPATGGTGASRGSVSTCATRRRSSQCARNASSA